MGRAVHVNGTAADGASANWEKKYFTQRGKNFTVSSFSIRNTDAANDLEFSLDNGNSFSSLAPGASFGEDLYLGHFYVRGSGGTATFEAMGNVL